MRFIPGIQINKCDTSYEENEGQENMIISISAIKSFDKI
jgi:hypothetical protein